MTDAKTAHFESNSALLIMDYQKMAVDRCWLQEDDKQKSLGTAAKVLEHAREAKIPVIYVVVHFRPGFPEVSPINKMFGAAKAAGHLPTEGSEGATIDPKVAPKSGDITVVKKRVGALHNTDLPTILSAMGVKHLYIFGLSTSGVVLSTVRSAADQDYALTILQDLCGDLDPEVHKVLMEKVFPRQCTVSTSKDFLALVAKKA